MVKTKFEKIKKVRDEIERLNNAIEDSNASIGQLEVMESNGMPRSNRTQAANDTQQKLEHKLELLINQYSERVREEQELIMELNDMIIESELDPVLDETLRLYYIRPYFCNESKKIVRHNLRSLAKCMYTDYSTVSKRLKKALEIIGEKQSFN